MIFLHLRLRLLLFLGFLWINASIAQTQSLPITKWRTQLSVKKDLCTTNLNEVLKEIEALDSLKRCVALDELKKDSEGKDNRYNIRVKILQGRFSNLYPYCGLSPDLVALMGSALHQCYELGDDLLAAEIHLILSNLHYSRKELGLSVMHQQLAVELAEREGLDAFCNHAWTLYVLGNLLYNARDYQAAATFNKQALDYHGKGELNKGDTLIPYWSMNAWNHLGLSYERLGVYDSAFYAFNQAYALADNAFWKGLLQGNRGDVFFLQGKYDSAEVLLKYDYEQSLEANVFNNASITLQRLATITLSRGDYREALAMIREADMLERKDPNPDYRVHILHTYALIFKDLGMADSVLHYMELYKTVNEQIERQAALNRIEITQLRLANERNTHHVQTLQKEKSRIQLIRNFSIAMVIILGIMGYLYIVRLRLKNRLKQQEAVDRMKRAEIEAAHAKEQLVVFTEHLKEKTGLIESLQDRLAHKEMNEEQLSQLAQLTHHAILTEEDWDRFKILFEKVYPGFFHNLKRKTGDITLAELRMAALCKLQVTIKEAAGLLGISPNSVHKTRYRLKQRLGLEADQELETYFSYNEENGFR